MAFFPHPSTPSLAGLPLCPALPASGTGSPHAPRETKSGDTRGQRAHMYTNADGNMDRLGGHREEIPSPNSAPPSEDKGGTTIEMLPYDAPSHVHSSIRPTLAACLLFATSLPVALLILSISQEHWYTTLYLPIIVLVLLIIDLSMTLPTRTLLNDLRLPPRLYVGRTAHAVLRLGSPYSARPVSIDALLEFSVTPKKTQKDPSTLEFSVRPTPMPLKTEPVNILMDNTSQPRGSAPAPHVVQLPIFPQHRGKAKCKQLWLRWKAPLGLIQIQRRDIFTKTIPVIPDIQGIHEAALDFFAKGAIHGVKAQQFKGEGTEFDSLREYVHGMDSRFIDWKRSARHRKLVCKEFRQERNHNIVFGFDSGHLMLESINGAPRLDHAIKAGLLLSWVSLFSGDLVGGCGFGASFNNFLKPGRGMPYFTNVQNFTASLAYSTDETNFTLGLAELDRRLQRRSLIVLFTEFVDTISAELLIESLHRLKRKHVVLFVTMKDPLLTRLDNAHPKTFGDVAKAVVAHDFLKERIIVHERIRRLGIHCLDIPVERLSGAVLNRYLFIKQRGLL